MAIISSNQMSGLVPATESQVVHSSQVTLRWAYGLVPIIAGVDKFFNKLAHWEMYLNPMALRVVPVSDVGFMHIVGVIEIIAGALTLARPRVGGFVVMAWLFAIALQLVAMGSYLDIAVRDCVMALGALTLARLTPFVDRRENSVHP
jgi:uncharacterized membrane protein YphA (DoxX/SURF4 family)